MGVRGERRCRERKIGIGDALARVTRVQKLFSTNQVDRNPIKFGRRNLFYEQPFLRSALRVRIELTAAESASRLFCATLLRTMAASEPAAAA